MRLIFFLASELMGIGIPDLNSFDHDNPLLFEEADRI